MPNSDFSTPGTDLDELARLELAIAQRADELVRYNAGRCPARDFWQEAEHEFWAARFQSLGPELAVSGTILSGQRG